MLLTKLANVGDLAQILLKTLVRGKVSNATCGNRLNKMRYGFMVETCINLAITLNFSLCRSRPGWKAYLRPFTVFKKRIIQDNLIYIVLLMVLICLRAINSSLMKARMHIRYLYKEIMVGDDGIEPPTYSV